LIRENEKRNEKRIHNSVPNPRISPYLFYVLGENEVLGNVIRRNKKQENAIGKEIRGNVIPGSVTRGNEIQGNDIRGNVTRKNVFLRKHDSVKCIFGDMCFQRDGLWGYGPKGNVIIVIRRNVPQFTRKWSYLLVVLESFADRKK
jgi:hypothetical protein